jgi:hypothetical protein
MGGKSKSEKKLAAVKLNGRAGGRPSAIELGLFDLYDAKKISADEWVHILSTMDAAVRTAPTQADAGISGVRQMVIEEGLAQLHASGLVGEASWLAILSMVADLPARCIKVA